VALRFAMHLTLNTWVFTGYLRLVKSGWMQAALFCLVSLFFVSLVAILPSLPQAFRFSNKWWSFFLVFASLMIWEHMSVVFPLTPFSLFTNSSWALRSVSSVGLEPLRVLLMLAAASVGLLWWSDKRKFAAIPMLGFFAVIMIAGMNASKTECVQCADAIRSVDLIQLKDGHNGGEGLKGSAEKIPWIRELPAVSSLTWTIWPEGAFDDVDSQSPAFEELISVLSKQPQRIHFFGGLRRKGEFSTPTTFVVNSQGLVTEQGKVHPFPVGEWSPYPKFVSEFGWVADKAKLIKPADKAVPIILQEEPHFVFVTFICSDALTESHVREVLTEARKTGKQPVVIQIFNDVWFDGTLEPEQHSQVVRLWAAAFGVYWFRAGMTGETEVISPQGEIILETKNSSRQVLSYRSEKTNLESKQPHPEVEMTEHSER
jgi:apolipoprotein N-acyltransferase